MGGKVHTRRVFPPRRPSILMNLLIVNLDKEFVVASDSVAIHELEAPPWMHRCARNDEICFILTRVDYKF